MTHRKLSRIVAIGILAVVLALPGPVWAAAGQPRGPAASVFDWLSGLWERGISALWSWSEAGQKSGSVDSGSSSTGQSPTSSTPTGTTGSGDETDNGAGFDPNG
jgi:hypothetical protein